MKSLAIRTFGERDKDVLLAGIGLVLAAAAIGLGIASVRRPWTAFTGLFAFAAIGAAAALTRPTAGPADALPAAAGAVVGAIALLALRRSGPRRPGGPRAEARRADGRELDRRRFLLSGAAGAAVRIPAPVSRAAPPTGAELRVPGLGPFFTPNERFYRVDTALLVPAVMAEDWRLRVHGMVDREITLDYEQLLSRPLVERDITLTCVSNPVGGRYAGNARWIGAPLRDLLLEAGPDPGADQIVSRSVDGFTLGTPTAVAALVLVAAACGGDSTEGDGGDGAAAAGPFGSACAEVPASGAGSFEGMMTEPVVTAASANPLLSSLVTDIDLAGLTDTLNTAEDLTVFAPSNAAFEAAAAADPEGMEAMMADPTGDFADLLAYHVVGGQLPPPTSPASTRRCRGRPSPSKVEASDSR